MTVLYVKIFRETEKRQRDLEHLTADRRQPQLVSQKSTSSSDDPAHLTGAGLPNSLSPTTPSLRKSSSLIIPSSSFDTRPDAAYPLPWWRRVCHCYKIDRDPVEYVEDVDDSTDDVGETNNTAASDGNTATATATATGNNRVAGTNNNRARGMEKSAAGKLKIIQSN